MSIIVHAWGFKSFVILYIILGFCNLVYYSRFHHSAIRDYRVCFNKHHEWQYGCDVQGHGHQSTTGYISKFGSFCSV